MSTKSFSNTRKAGGHLGRGSHQLKPGGLLHAAGQSQPNRTGGCITSRLDMIRRRVGAGFPVFPVKEGGKEPAIANGFKAASADERTVDAWFRGHPNLNFGIPTGATSAFFVLDVDGAEGRVNLDALTKMHGSLPITWTVKTPHGEHRYFKMPNYPVPNSTGRVAKGIDVRGDGGYVVGPGSEAPDGHYRFVPGQGPDDVEIAAAPGWLLGLIGTKPSAVANSSIPARKLSEHERARAVRYADAALRSELDRLRKAPLHQRNNTLNVCALKLGHFVARGFLDSATVAGELGQVAEAIGLGEIEIMPTIESGLRAGMKTPARLPFEKSGPSSIDAKPPVPSDEQLASELAPLGETDVANADRFVERFGHKVIFSEHRGWMAYDGKRYRPNSQVRCVELGKEVVKKIGDELPFLADEQARARRARFAVASQSKGAIDRMLDLAKGCLIVDDASLDADPWLLNTETFTIDLRTGQYHPHDARDLLTKIAPVKAKPNSKCPVFEKFLRRITAADDELATYIQKAVGYTLTGITTEQVFFFVHGQFGGTGKSTLVNLLRDLLGDYGCHTPTETLLTKQYDNAIPADLARLNGARMVTAIESNVNRQLDEARIKGMTGGEPITARSLYKEYFTFTPQFKLWFVANDRPHVRATSDAIWRRIRVIPLNVKIPADEVDPGLPLELKARWPGILSWAIRGALKWQQEGLAEPAAVEAASAGWRKAVDHVRRFVTETLITGCDQGEVVPAGELHSAFKTWCAHHGERPLSPGQFNAKLEEAFDLTHARSKCGSEWRGVRWKR